MGESNGDLESSDDGKSAATSDSFSVTPPTAALQPPMQGGLVYLLKRCTRTKWDTTNAFYIWKY
jgi:hypothetical protein